ncbi:hypothetical protein JAAARDRAFT_207998 [Jaapia argillacea MUCL 33604]|uniref:Protein kinase domain-containing protein n=1 Tax=Jaapia argillacea MUCL 33604 TaxID=933084 RepID=A0A067PNB1_9AGAM|nr:hypothetical protein JAAARDRAFT_207998 [Jaapia argillacea MUCL 33604]
MPSSGQIIAKELQFASTIFAQLQPDTSDLEELKQQEARFVIHVKRIIEEPIEKLREQLSHEYLRLLVDILHHACDRSLFAPQESTINWHHPRSHHILYDLAISHHKLPSSIAIDSIQRKGKDPIGSGGSSSIYMGYLRGKPVALKRIRISFSPSDFESDGTIKKLYHEAAIWQSLKHPNILPLLGIHQMDEDPCPFVFVSPWMSNGNITEYVQRNCLSTIQTCILLDQVARGLEYLHNEALVHGDIKGANILISQKHHVQISDFGLSLTAEMVQCTNAGSLRWMAPELLQPASSSSSSSSSSISTSTPEPAKKPTTATDVYSFGLTCLEVFTSQIPFQDRSELDLLKYPCPPKRPPKDPYSGRYITDMLWAELEKCWVIMPKGRPGMNEVCCLVKDLGPDGPPLFRNHHLTPAGDPYYPPWGSLSTTRLTEGSSFQGHSLTPHMYDYIPYDLPQQPPPTTRSRVDPVTTSANPSSRNDTFESTSGRIHPTTSSRRMYASDRVIISTDLSVENDVFDSMSSWSTTTCVDIPTNPSFQGDSGRRSSTRSQVATSPSPSLQNDSFDPIRVGTSRRVPRTTPPVITSTNSSSRYAPFNLGSTGDPPGPPYYPPLESPPRRVRFGEVSYV